MPEDFPERVPDYRKRVNATLEHWLALDPGAPERLRSAMAYAVLGEGKRIRPLLCYATAELLQLTPEQVDPIAAAVEFVHAYSLVHDDLPAMDDDDLRRGRPTTHRAYDDATAILVGDALQALAFRVLVEDPALAGHAPAQVALVRALTDAAGPSGMVGGQILDLAAEGRTLTVQELEDLHNRKTGRLIRASVLMPVECAEDPSETTRAPLTRFADRMGLAFQVRDDLLEVEQDTATLRKSVHSDDAKQKSTYPRLMGAEQARKRADQLYAEALGALEAFGPAAGGLRWLCDYIVHRNR